MEFTKILKKPNRLSKNQIGYLKSIVDDFAYLQSARAIYLKALKDSNSFKFHSELKITAAYSSERNVLFDFITDQKENESKPDLNKVDLSKESIEEKKSFVSQDQLVDHGEFVAVCIVSAWPCSLRLFTATNTRTVKNSSHTVRQQKQRDKGGRCFD